MKNIVNDFSYDEHKQRLLNLQLVEQSVVRYKRREMISNYIPGQYIYTGRNPGNPEDDDRLFAKLKENGVGLIQLWSRWYDNPWQGMSMYQPRDSAGTHQFLELAHKHGLKVLPYTSTNFYERTDPFFNPGWAFPQPYDLVEFDYHLAHCSASSPGWRAHILHQLTNLMDNYAFDGIYNDTGYIRKSDYYHSNISREMADEIPAFSETRDYDGGMEDMLGLIYSEVKRRNGIVKVHKDGADKFHVTQKIYDYLWVGEGVKSLETVRDLTMNYDPYVVPDFNFSTDNEDLRYLNTIPFMQFPIVRDATVGIASEDAAVPDTERTYSWLKLYNKMATEGAWFYMDVEAPRILPRKGLDTVVSLFVNLDLYVVAANFSDKEDTIGVTGEFVKVDPVLGETRIGHEITLAPQSFCVLKKVQL